MAIAEPGVRPEGFQRECTNLLGEPVVAEVPGCALKGGRDLAPRADVRVGSYRERKLAEEAIARAARFEAESRLALVAAKAAIERSPYHSRRD